MTDDFRFRWLDMVHKANLTDSAKVVGAYLFARAGADYTCFPSIAAIAEDCGRSHHTAQRAIAQLHAAGFLVVGIRGGPLCQDRRNRIPLYTLQGVPAVESLNAQGVPNQAPRGAKLDDQGVPPVEPGIDHRTDQEQTSKTKERAPARDTSQLDAQCLTIYEAYPRHVGRKPALKAIAKALQVIPYADLIGAVIAFAAAKEGADLKFVAHPATWFNGERWNDDRAEWSRWRQSGRPRDISRPDTPKDKYAGR